MTEDTGFTKYGVLEDKDHAEDTLKEGSECLACPVCGMKLLEPHKTNVLSCPKCGTLPFE